MSDTFLNQSRLANRWQISARTLERWRWKGEGPAFVKIGGRVVYRLEEIVAYEQLGAARAPRIACAAAERMMTAAARHARHGSVPRPASPTPGSTRSISAPGLRRPIPGETLVYHRGFLAVDIRRAALEAAPGSRRAGRCACWATQRCAPPSRTSSTSFRPGCPQPLRLHRHRPAEAESCPPRSVVPAARSAGPPDDRPHPNIHNKETTHALSREHARRRGPAEAARGRDRPAAGRSAGRHAARDRCGGKTDEGGDRAFRHRARASLRDPRRRGAPRQRKGHRHGPAGRRRFHRGRRSAQADRLGPGEAGFHGRAHRRLRR